MVSPGSTRTLADSRAAAPETPFFFESAGRPLYAVFHTPALSAAPRSVMVHCHSLGVEQMTLYRAEVLAAHAAAAAGVPALRWHARGHGDSAGDFSAVTFETLVEDALAAADEALRRSGAQQVVWLGARIGALVAAEAARRRGDRAGIALWEPVHRPAEYFRGQLRGLLFSQVASGKRPDATVEQLLERVGQEGAVDVHGYYLHRALVESMKALELGARLESFRGGVLLAQIQTRAKLSPANAALAATLESRGLAVAISAIAEEPGWHFISNPAWECEALTQATVEWLHAVA